MLLTILFGAIAARMVFPHISIWEAEILAAILAPTDAGLGQVIVNSPRVPTRIRQALNVEAGLNDGLSVPFLLFFIALAAANTEGRNASLMQFIMEQLGVGTLVGVREMVRHARSLRAQNQPRGSLELQVMFNGVISNRHVNQSSILKPRDEPVVVDRIDGDATVARQARATPLASTDCLIGECVHRGTCRGQHVEDVGGRGAAFVQVGFDPLQDGVRLAHDPRDIRLLSQKEHEQDFDRDEPSRNLNA